MKGTSVSIRKIGFAVLGCAALGAGVLFAEDPAGGATSTAGASGPEIIVQAEALSFSSGKSSSATLTSTRLVEIPSSMDVITSQVIQERRPGTFYDTLRYASGVQTGGRTPFSNSSGQPSLRGFTHNDVLLNGSPLPATMSIFLGAANIERIDILKGPINAITGGAVASQNGIGGAFNVITKTPVADPFGNVDVSGSFNGGEAYRVALDVNQPLDPADLYMRYNIAADLEHPFYLPGDIDCGQRVFFAPSWLYALADNFSVSLDLSVQWEDTAAYQGIPYYRGNFITDMDQYYGNNDTRNEYLGVTCQLRADWDLSDSLALKSGVSYTRFDLERSHWAAQCGAPQGMTTEQFYDSVVATRKSTFSYYQSDRMDENLGAFARLFKKLEWPGMMHQLVGGLDWIQKNNDTLSSKNGTSGLLDIDDPELTLPQRLTSSSGSGDTSVERYGLLVQDQVSAGDWRVLAGARFDEHRNDDGDHRETLNPRGGITYMLTPDLAVYGNYTYTEGPNYGYQDINGEDIEDPWTAEVMECGVRLELAGDFWCGIAGFDQRRKNMPQSLPDNPDLYELGGENVSQGVEVSLFGNVLPAWQCQLSYTYTEYEDKDARLKFDRFPPHSVSLWQSFKLPESLLGGSRLGIGYQYVHSFMGTFRGQYIGEDYEIGGYNVVDVSIDVPLKSGLPGSENAVLHLGVANVFDEEYVESTRHVSEAFPGDPRTFIVALRGTY